jgi:hypothetical protein
MYRNLSVVVAGMALAGCAAMSLNPYQHALHATAGPEPDPARADEVVAEYLQRSLKDPESVKQFRKISTQKTRWLRGAINGGGSEEGWLICFELNAKNSYGGYTGLKTMGLVVRTRDDGSVYTVEYAMTQIMSPTCGS